MSCFHIVRYFFSRSRGVSNVAGRTNIERRTIPQAKLWPGRLPLSTLRGKRRSSQLPNGAAAAGAKFPHKQHQTQRGPLMSDNPNAAFWKIVQNVSEDTADLAA